MHILFVIKTFFYDLRIMFFSMRVIDKKNCVKSSYCMRHTLILKKLRICNENLHCFSLFGVLYNCVKFRRLKMGDPVYIIYYNENCPLLSKLAIKQYFFHMYNILSDRISINHGIKKTRYDITHFTESQHGKYGNLKNGRFCKNSSRSQYNFRFGSKTKPTDLWIA